MQLNFLKTGLLAAALSLGLCACVPGNYSNNNSYPYDNGNYGSYDRSDDYDRCPEGFSRSRQCSRNERRDGCEEIRLRNGEICTRYNRRYDQDNHRYEHDHHDSRPPAWQPPPPPPPARVEHCPAGYTPRQQRCSQNERKHGCTDVRISPALGCVKLH